MAQLDNQNFTGLVAGVLRIPKAEVVDTLDMEGTSTWDSLSHMQLIAALEEEYHFELTADEIIAMRTIGQIKDILRSHSITVA